MRVAAVVEASKESLKPGTAAAETAPASLTVDALADCEFNALKVVAVDGPPTGKESYVRLLLAGTDGARTVVVCTGSPHDLQDLVGRSVLVLTNLRPKVIQGEESQGMIMAIAAVDRPARVLVTTD